MDVFLRSAVLTTFWFMLAGAGVASAQSGEIAGQVTDMDTGEPVPLIRVEVLAGGGRVVATTNANVEGRFRITGISPGTYTLSLTGALSYPDTRIQDVIVTAGEQTVVNSALRQTAVPLQHLIVSGGIGTVESLTEIPQGASVVAREEVESRPAISHGEHLRKLRGVDITDNSLTSQNIVTRGFNNIFSGSLNMLTDFRLAGIPSLRVNFIHFVPQTNEDIQRMEVLLGPASARYGPNTANGVLHMITKSPFDEQTTTATATAGERDLLHVTGRTSHVLTPTLGAKISGQFMRADDWEYIDPVEASTRERADDPDPLQRFLFRASQPLGPDGQPLPEEELDRRIALIGVRDFDLQRWSLDGRVDWRPNDRLSTVLSAGRTMTNRGLELTGIGAGQVRDWAYSYYQGRLNWGRVFAQAYLNTSDAGDTYLLRTGTPITDRSKLVTAQLQHGFEVGEWQSLGYGVDYIRTMPETEGSIHGSYEDDDTIDELGAYVQSTTRLSSQLDLVLAGRVDDHSRLPEPVFSPRAALVFKPTETQSLRATFNRAFSTPSSLNLFLDIDAGWAGTAIGPMGFRVRAFGVGEDGIRFRNPEGGLFGMRSPSAAAVGSTPGAMMPIDAATLYRVQIENFLTVAGAAGQQIAPLLRSFQQDPLLPTGIVALDAATNDLFDPNLVQDIPGLRESISQTFEVGYRGILQGVLSGLDLAADIWIERKENFTSPLLVQTPLLLMHPVQLRTYLEPRLTAAFIAGGMSPEAAAQQAAATAGLIAQVPGAVVTSPDLPATASDLIATYRNFGEIDLWGVDLGATINLTNWWTFGVTASFVKDDHFKLDLDGIEQIVALNAPKRKGTASLAYRNPQNGLNGELRVRHNAEFPVSSAGYVGMQCIDADLGSAVLNEPCVESFNIVDVGVGYQLPMLPGASIQLNVQNLLDEDFRGFVGTPTIGRLALLRLKYDFGGGR